VVRRDDRDADVAGHYLGMEEGVFARTPDAEK